MWIDAMLLAPVHKLIDGDSALKHRLFRDFRVDLFNQVLRAFALGRRKCQMTLSSRSEKALQFQPDFTQAARAPESPDRSFDHMAAFEQSLIAFESGVAGITGGHKTRTILLLG